MEEIIILIIIIFHKKTQFFQQIAAFENDESILTDTRNIFIIIISANKSNHYCILNLHAIALEKI